ncbi:hypothetical protein [Pseudomaricurvus sp.]|uniref:lipid-binding SYLF domain-containing protein n=1 Tax=Pseudomaricurvus sp. TaxID=2004510 RepID=UPI003F6D2E28
MKSTIKLLLPILTTSLLFGCATGDTPDTKKMHASEETSAAMGKVLEAHPSAQTAINQSKAYLVCTGSDSYLFAVASGGGICVLNEKPQKSYYRFASVGAGVGIGFKKVAFVYAYMTDESLKRFKEEGVDAGARAETSAKYEDKGDQVSANTSYDTKGVKVFQTNLAGAAAQATVQGYKFWETDFTKDVVQKSE